MSNKSLTKSKQLSFFSEKELVEMEKESKEKKISIEDQIYELMEEKGLDYMDYYSPLLCSRTKFNNNE